MTQIIEDNTILKVRSGVDLNNLSISSQEAYILSRIDGKMTVRDLYQVSLLDKTATAAVLKNLIDQGVLAEVDPPNVVKLPIDYQCHEYGSTIFSLPALQEDCEPDRNWRKEILFLHENMERLNHFEFMGLEVSAEEAEIKKAFVRLSKILHPDSYYGRNMGTYKKRLSELYNHLSEAYRLLIDPKTRFEYKRKLSIVCGEPDWAKEEETPEERARKNRQIAKEKRLKSNPMMGRVNKANEFYQAGLSDLEKQKWISAANNFKMALTYDPLNELYKLQLEKVADAANRVAAERHFQRGQTLEAYGQDGYMEAYEKAAQAYPASVEFNLKISGLYGDQGDWDKAEHYAARAVSSNPKNIDARMTYGKILMKRKNKEKAAQQFEAILKLDPNNESAKVNLKEAKRWFQL